MVLAMLRRAGRGQRRLVFAAAGFALVAVAGVAGLAALDRAFPPPLDLPDDYSVEVLDRDGEPLHFFANREGRWRLKTDLDAVDPGFIEMLVAYEDKRFWNHSGVDLLALGRAAGQFVASGRIVSGGSTLTMQLARRLEPRTERSVAAKLRQIVRAWQIERRLTKHQILERYLTLAPYGGNVEGIRAASHTWFGKEPKKLALREAALLVALPQSPERRRPDRYHLEAKAARDRVIMRLAGIGLADVAEADRVARFAVPSARQPMPRLAAHLAQDAIDRDPTGLSHETRLDAPVQAQLETLAKTAARRFGPRVSLALVAADVKSGDILASVGSPDVLDGARQGWVDMTQALRSPGSTLKPLVYGVAIEDGLVMPETMISDRPSSFGGYRPANFDLTYQGDITVRRALQMSLNVPAVSLADAVSPLRLVARIRRAGVTPQFAGNDRPGLSLVLGGASFTLTDLVQLYANLASPGAVPMALGDGVRSQPGSLSGAPVLNGMARWHVADMLSGIDEPVGAPPRKLAYKTGTSYGYRDAWAIGFDGRHVIGVWVGRADNGSVPGISGMKSAAPILFEAFGKAGFRETAFAQAPAGALRLEARELPAGLRKFENPGSAQRFATIAPRDRLEISFPVDGAELETSSFADGTAAPVVVKLRGGVPPFRLLADDRPQEGGVRRRQLQWLPPGQGVARLTVTDAIGQARSVSVRIR